MAGALEGLTVIEFAGIGPGPFACMMLADHGARVIRIDRPGASRVGDDGQRDILNRNRQRIALDLKDRRRWRALRAGEGGRCHRRGLSPGVMERLGLGPDVLLADNPRLVYGRMTGWGQDGPMAPLAGHDINYIALSGALHTYGEAGASPSSGQRGRRFRRRHDDGVRHHGGGVQRRTTGKGQVVDCAMVDGAAILSAMTWTFFGNGIWKDERGVNLLDGARISTTPTRRRTASGFRSDRSNRSFMRC
jgi:alpha-methylacyl-CoA racemase